MAVHVNLQDIDSDLCERALKIAHQFGVYVFKRLTKLNDPEQMLKTEYGGMNDALYELFDLTHDKRMLTAATYFDETALFKQLANGEDVLPGKHANTTIPKLIGALHRYRSFHYSKQAGQYLNAEERASLDMYLQAAVNFWQIVVDDHSYVTGGNSQSEHFYQADAGYHDAFLEDGATTCETCNTHNMLKLSRELFRITGDKKYLDYYDRTYTNAILGSQNPETGMMAYFQPMAAGYTKVFNRPDDEFWCCTGTGIESFTKLGDSYYFRDGNDIMIALYRSNRLDLPQHNLQINQNVDQQTGQVTVSLTKIHPEQLDQPINLYFRQPDWMNGSLKILGAPQTDLMTDRIGFVGIAGICANARLTTQLIYHLAVHSTADNQRYIALSYGPYVLAGALDTYQMMADRPNGILVRIAAQNPASTTTLTAHTGWSKWRKSLAKATVSTTAPQYLFDIQLPGIDEAIHFVPYNQLFDRRYGIYFQWQQAGSPEAKKRQAELEAVERVRTQTVDELTNFDENNWGYDKHLDYQDSEIGSYRGRRFRQADAGGYFSYQFQTGKAHGAVTLILTLNQADDGKKIWIRFNDDQQTERSIILDASTASQIDGQEFYEWKMTIPAALLTGQQKLRVTFSADSQDSARVFGIRLMNEEQ